MFAAIRRASSFVSSLAGRSPAGLLLEINASGLLAAMVDHDKARRLFLNRPGRREAAGSQFSGNLRPEQVAFRPLRTGL
jgi:hypothetical protein